MPEKLSQTANAILAKKKLELRRQQGLNVLQESLKKGTSNMPFINMLEHLAHKISANPVIAFLDKVQLKLNELNQQKITFDEFCNYVVAQGDPTGDRLQLVAPEIRCILCILMGARYETIEISDGPFISLAENYAHYIDSENKDVFNDFRNKLLGFIHHLAFKKINAYYPGYNYLYQQLKLDLNQCKQENQEIARRLKIVENQIKIQNLIKQGNPNARADIQLILIELDHDKIREQWNESQSILLKLSEEYNQVKKSMGFTNSENEPEVYKYSDPFEILKAVITQEQFEKEILEIDQQVRTKYAFPKPEAKDEKLVLTITNSLHQIRQMFHQEQKQISTVPVAPIITPPTVETLTTTQEFKAPLNTQVVQASSSNSTEPKKEIQAPPMISTNQKVSQLS